MFIRKTAGGHFYRVARELGLTMTMAAEGKGKRELSSRPLPRRQRVLVRRRREGTRVRTNNKTTLIISRQLTETFRSPSQDPALLRARFRNSFTTLALAVKRFTDFHRESDAVYRLSNETWQRT